MSEVSNFRLLLLRSMYLLIVVGLAVTIWPGIISPPANMPTAKGLVPSMLAALSVLAALGIRYPLKLLPLLFFEFLWKFIWVIVYALPHGFADTMDTDTQENLFACLLGVVLVPLVIPWGYAFREYVAASGDRWRGRLDSPRAPSAFTLGD